MQGVLSLILGGGRGTRLYPLTKLRSKPAVPLGGKYRLIDIPISNCINSGLRRVLVLTQYKARSLDRHIASGWGFLSRELGEFIECLPPQQRIDEHWYKGTADAIYQNIYSIEKEDPRYVLILSGDLIYKMDYSDMLASHITRQADLTIGCIPVPIEEARHFVQARNVILVILDAGEGEDQDQLRKVQLHAAHLIDRHFPVFKTGLFELIF